MPKEKPKIRRVFYYYALKFHYEFEFDDDTVYFAFSRPLTYTDILTDLHKTEKAIMPGNNFKKDLMDENF